MHTRMAKQRRRLKTAGLVAIAAATLLMGAWAVFPTAASSAIASKGNSGAMGGADPAGVTTTTAVKQRIRIVKQTVPSGDPATFGFSGDIVATLGDGGSAGTNVDPGTYTVSESPLPGWTLTSISCNDDNSSGSGNTATFQVETGEIVTCTFTNTKGETTTSTTTTTTTSTTTTQTTTSTTSATSSTSSTTTGTTVSGTTVTPPSSTTSRPGTTVSGTTVTPPGTAFTGLENVVPFGTIALILMTGGSGLMWAAARRRRGDDPDDEE